MKRLTTASARLAHMRRGPTTARSAGFQPALLDLTPQAGWKSVILSPACPLLGLVGAVAFMFAGTATAADWPQWRGLNRDGRVSGFIAPTNWPGKLTLKWKVKVGSGDATPALVGNRLYVFAREDTNEITRCLDAETGKVLWQDRYPAPEVSGPDIGHGGPRSSPAVAAGRVITLGVCGTLSCLDAGTGRVLWRKDEFPRAWPQFHTAMSPIIVDGLCIAHLGKEDGGALVAYDLDTGASKWKWMGDGPAYASPVILAVGGTKMIVSLTAGNLVGVGAADGRPLWRLPFAAQGMPYNAVTPIVHGQTVIYGGSGRGLKAAQIEKQGDQYMATHLWSNPEVSVQFSTPVLKDELLFGLSQRGRFFCVNAKTGKTAWIESTGGRGDFGALVDAGSVVLGLTATSQLTVFEPSAERFTELAKLKVADTQTYAHPVLAGHRVYVKDQDSVRLWLLE